MNTKKTTAGLITFIIASAIGGTVLFIPNLDKRLVALIGTVLFACFSYFMFKRQQNIFTQGRFFLLSVIWMILFPIPYVITHPWTVITLLTLLACVIGIITGQKLVVLKTVQQKLICVLLAIIAYVVFNILLYPYLYDWGMSLLPN